MNWQYIMTNRAQSEFLISAEWYEKISIELEKRFIQAIFESLEIIKENPESYPAVKRYFKQFVVRNFPFVIVFSLNNKKNKILIHSIFHTSRNPKKIRNFK